MHVIVGAPPAPPTLSSAYSASMNSYLSLTDAPSRSKPCFFQERILDFQLAVKPFQLAQPGSLQQL